MENYKIYFAVWVIADAKKVIYIEPGDSGRKYEQL